jgi:methionine-rich copper-binding protein CopC
MYITKVFPIFILSVIAFGYLLSIPSNAYGHASPIIYNPQPNQIFNSSQLIPDKLSITFTETPEVKASNIKAFDQNNVRIDKNDLSISESEKKLLISLDKSKINSGIYNVNWLVLSKEDGHITKGAYIFSLNNSNSSDRQQHLQTINQSSIFSKNYIKDNLNITLDIYPFKAGHNTFNITVEGIDNDTTVENIKNVFLEFNNPDKNIGPLVDTMKQISVGKYSSSGNFISQPGNWEVKVIIQRIGAYDVNQSLNVNIP